jgi:hypothetical protein
MKITVAGEDRSGDLGSAVLEQAAALRAAGSAGALSPEHSALSLRQASDADEYLNRFIGLIRMRHGVRTTDYYIPRAPGLRGRVSLSLKTFLWKLLRHQHERIAFQQNLINELEINSAEFQRDRLKQEIAELKRRLDSLEKSLPGGAAP